MKLADRIIDFLLKYPELELFVHAMIIIALIFFGGFLIQIMSA